jgi:hypothetical protein
MKMKIGIEKFCWQYAVSKYMIARGNPWFVRQELVL